jgi:hypothetical protein
VIIKSSKEWETKPHILKWMKRDSENFSKILLEKDGNIIQEWLAPWILQPNDLELAKLREKLIYSGLKNGVTGVWDIKTQNVGWEVLNWDDLRKTPVLGKLKCFDIEGDAFKK